MANFPCPKAECDPSVACTGEAPEVGKWIPVTASTPTACRHAVCTFFAHRSVVGRSRDTLHARETSATHGCTFGLLIPTHRSVARPRSALRRLASSQSYHKHFLNVCSRACVCVWGGCVYRAFRTKKHAGKRCVKVCVEVWGWWKGGWWVVCCWDGFAKSARERKTKLTRLPGCSGTKSTMFTCFLARRNSEQSVTYCVIMGCKSFPCFGYFQPFSYM